jgi:hypothetical protein
MIRAALIPAVVAGMAVLSAAQSDTAAGYEVASIKTANPATLYASSGSEGTRWLANNFTVFMPFSGIGRRRRTNARLPHSGEPIRIGMSAVVE